ncbi:MAG: hypothetical protein HC839_02045 [Leptolyngbyaceae cyanobacterium RM2_2_21]|nr:hypothetical protein [Leptolyngbyaceae cyanobacterium RM2_2_21]
MAQASQGESDLLPETANSAIDDLANEASLADTPDRLIASKDGDDQPTESFVEFPTETDSSEIFSKTLVFSEQFQTAAAREGSSIRREESQLAALIVDDVLSQDEADDNHSAIGSPDVNTYLEDSAVAPAVIAQAATIPNGQVPAGIPVPWTLSQVPSGVPQAGFPATPSAAGSWVMVWIPNGSSPVPIGSDGSAANLPNNIPQQAYYQAWMPVGTPGQTLPGNVPWANPAASSGYGYPYGGAPSQPALSQPVNQAGFSRARLRPKLMAYSLSLMQPSICQPRFLRAITFPQCCLAQGSNNPW